MAAGAHDVLEGAALVGGITLDGLDEIADQVMTALEFDIDLAPGLLDQIALLDQAVVDAHGPEREEHDQAEDDEQRDEHQVSRLLSWRPGWERARNLPSVILTSEGAVGAVMPVPGRSA